MYQNKSSCVTRRAFLDVTNSSAFAEACPVGKKGGTTKPCDASAAIQKRQTRSMTAVTRAPVPAARPVARRESGVLDSSSSARSANPDSYQCTGPVDNIDERDRDDPLCATEYVQEMYAHFRKNESTTWVTPDYMDDQPEINQNMRAILVDWLVDVHLKFKLIPETIYLAVNLLDRYLEKREVDRPGLQLVGVACLLIASKYEEIYPIQLRDLVYVCDRAYIGIEIIEMEETVLKALSYKVTIASSHAFLVRYLKAAHADKKMVQHACYFLEGTLQSYHRMRYLPSELAAASVMLARRCVNRHSWSPTLLQYSKYCAEEVVPVARVILAEKFSAVPDLRAVNKKYSSRRYGEVASTDISDI